MSSAVPNGAVPSDFSCIPLGVQPKTSNVVKGSNFLILGGGVFFRENPPTSLKNRTVF